MFFPLKCRSWAKNEIPSEFTLAQNYPNPFNPSTKITFTIPSEGNVTVRIYNSLTQIVETLYDKYITAGLHEMEWNAKNVASGMYIYSVTYKNQTLSQRMMFMK